VRLPRSQGSAGSRVLNRVHGLIGEIECVSDLVTGCAKVNTNTAADINLVAVHTVRITQSCVDSRRQPSQAGLGDSRCAHGKPVASESSDGVLGPHLTAQPVGDGEQDLVTGVVTVAVVDRLEVLEIDIQQANVGDGVATGARGQGVA